MQGRNLDEADRRGIQEGGLHGAVDQFFIVWDWLTLLCNRCPAHRKAGDD
jgi:hypothetical protein